jgi:NhaP-type Na+/H+ or K+/H+ antiporter
MVLIELGRGGYEKVVAVITLTVLLSIFLHGISAIPYSKMYEREPPLKN